GDILTLIDKAQVNFDETKAKEMEKKFKKAEFDFNDFLEQMQQVKKMGGISSLLGMLPGAGKQLKGVEVDENALTSTEAIIYSMTKKERANPDILNIPRKKRIAAGAGVNINDVNALVKQFEQSKKMMKQFSGMMGKGGRHGNKFGKSPFGF
ncbi:MAG: signal recognition particle protein, partial [Mobilitalea sp.]